MADGGGTARGTRTLDGKVAVVTGASSGIGRATALELARRGASVVAAARREAPLRSLVEEIEGGGGSALGVPTEVADPSQVDALADAAIERYGRLDAWVNAAAVAIYGRFEDISPEAFRRVIDVDLFGYVHGTRAALRAFHRTGEGVIVEVASVEGVIGTPYQSPYAMAKHAVVALAEALRQELADEPGIHVVTVMPAGVDTPFFIHAANQTGRAPKPPNPVYAPEHIARVIADTVEHPKREVVVGRAGRTMTALRQISPALFERLHLRQVEADGFEQRPAPPTDGTLFQPMGEGTTTGGGWPRTGEGPLRATTVAAVALGVGALVGAAVLRGRTS